ncbi:MAG: hypothetical protein LBV32_03195 [Tannerellaceae bacterium]|jgi:hypothetical protein|nr:hypothetical protein [Tannerellaceae bacterium]
MTTGDYITRKFQSFGIDLSEADILDVSLSSGLNTDDEVSKENHHPVTVAMVQYIPNLLLRASSFTENKLSMSWDIDGIKAFYSMKCREYGLEDNLNSNKPTVTFW